MKKIVLLKLSLDLCNRGGHNFCPSSEQENERSNFNIIVNNITSGKVKNNYQDLY